MPVRKYKPTTPGRRGASVSSFQEITRETPEKSLTRRLPRKAGRNTYGRITVEEPVAAGVAAVYAYERQVPAVARAKVDGLRAHFGVDDPRTLAFFD